MKDRKLKVFLVLALCIKVNVSFETHSKFNDIEQWSQTQFARGPLEAVLGCYRAARSPLLKGM